MRKLLPIFLILIAGWYNSYSQIQCGFDARLKYLKENDPQFLKAYTDRANAWKEYIEQRSAQKLVINNTDTTIDIPVVFHVVHTGGAVGTEFNPSDTLLLSLLSYMNKTFNADWPSYPTTGNGGARIPIRFTFARRDQNCAAINGINRVNGSVIPGYTQDGVICDFFSSVGVPFSSVMDIAQQPGTEVMNIWIVNKINGCYGFANGFPYYFGQKSGGLFIDVHSAFAGNSGIIHELGHAFGLYHTFEGDWGGSVCPLDTNCLVNGDLICDTEPHTTTFACNLPMNQCTNSPFNKILENFMSYSVSCHDRFTPGQGQMMVWTAKNYLTSLINSTAMDLPIAQLPPSACVPIPDTTATPYLEGIYKVDFHSISRGSGGYLTEYKKVYVDNSCNYRTRVYKGQSYPISIMSGYGWERASAFIDYNNDGNFASNELVFVDSTATGYFQVHTGIVNIPSINIIMNQWLRMRVITTAPPQYITSACGFIRYGQAEDYGVMIVDPAGISDFPMADVSLYPNPAADYITLKASVLRTWSVPIIRHARTIVDE
jgi:hypothetical protein